AMRAGPRRGPGAGRRGPGAAGGRGRGERGMRKSRTGQSGNLSTTVDPNKVVEIEPPITVKGLSEALGVKVTDLIAALTFKLGVAGKNINSFLSEEEVELVALEVERKIKIVERKEAEEELLQDLHEAAKEVESETRAPVLTFMGHVDHGKTTLLDALRESDVVKGEAGGITQHIGAYRITRDDGAFVVLDTPGHEAFTSMRARGASITDIVVLVVAADDGVMPQTEEAIAHAKDAKVPIIVAINKCDRPNANPMQVMQQLAVKGLQSEAWGGDVQCVEVSALTGQGLDDLVEQILLQAEILELHAKPDAAGEGVVIESKQSPEQGAVVNVLVTNGTLRLRDQVLCGESLSRIRGIIDDHGNQIQEAPPSTPVSLLGMTSLPSPGDKLFVITDKKKAKEVVEDRQRTARNMSLAERSAQTKVTLANLSETLEAQKQEELKVILKADVMGSLEPIKNSLDRIATDEVRVNIIHSALGGITETDVALAEAGGAMVIGFNTVADQTARQAADQAGVEIRYYSVIYELLDEVRLAMEGKLAPEEIEEITGHAEIKAVFRSSKFGNIAGLMIDDGNVTRNSHVRLSRDGKVVHRGTVSSLRREKDDVREVKSGYECGLTIKDFNDIKVGDQLEFFDIKYVKRTLS
ncbi:MAG: translation initiation factor IF-2, partial [Planctomycetes bacterium]|nr:translation initiation factor IF-2 [Planctomycetota bacterium]